MAEPSDQMPAAAGRGDLRASHADREDVIKTLKAAFVQGRLTKDEFDLRVGRVLASRTYAELAFVTADLPSGLTLPELPKPARVRPKRPILRPRVVMTVASVTYAGMWPLALALAANSDGYPVVGVNLVGSATLFYVLVMLLTIVWAQVLGSREESRQEKRVGGQLGGGQTPGAGGQAARRLPSANPAADPGGQVPPVDPVRRHSAEVARRRLPRPPSPARGHRAGGALGTAAARG